MPLDKSDIQFYLTSVEPEIQQTIYSQSIGGYSAFVPGSPTLSVVYPSTTISADVDIYDGTITLASLGSFSGTEYISLNSELIKTESISSATVTVDSRYVNERFNAHISGDMAYAVSLKEIFNNQFNKDRKQYRCIAIRNNSSTDSANNVEIFFKHNSRNPSSTMRMAVEMPLNDHLSGTATGGTKTQLVDASQANLFDDNHFLYANLRVLSGSNVNQSRVIYSYTGSTGTFVFNDSLPFEMSSGDTYEIDAGPAQRVISGTIKPDTSSNRVTSFLLPTSEDPIGININGSRDHGSSLQTEDIIYIWLERSLAKDGAVFDNNNVVITLRYTL